LLTSWTGFPPSHEMHFARGKTALSSLAGVLSSMYEELFCLTRHAEQPHRVRLTSLLYSPFFMSLIF
jgi:hypothetical protein